jgi:stearoyl-CoA desaturase (delta-9 desaturase)
MNRENNMVSIGAVGEGFHNYHHVFPWDYKASELPSIINTTSRFIEFFAKIGWAYNLRVASPQIILKRIQRTGPKQ